jgi:hypothetical protein
MNATRRKTLGQVIDQIEALKSLMEQVKADIDLIKETIDTERDDEQEAFDNLPEGLQQAERGQAMEQAVEFLDNASTTLSDLFDAIDGVDFDDVISSIDDARGQA